jgi:hypothetical protein
MATKMHIVNERVSARDLIATFSLLPLIMMKEADII